MNERRMAMGAEAEVGRGAGGEEEEEEAQDSRNQYGETAGRADLTTALSIDGMGWMDWMDGTHRIGSWRRFQGRGTTKDAHATTSTGDKWNGAP